MVGGLRGSPEARDEVARSYRPGLFHCYAVPCLPRTNNGLEQLFGPQRHHERRATGRRTASPATVLRGEVRLIAATATRLRPPEASDLGRVSQPVLWKALARLGLRPKKTRAAKPAGVTR